MKNKIALITGASRGIGLAIMLELGRRGAYCVGADICADGVEAINKALQDNNLQGIGHDLDVTNPESIDQLLADMKGSCGLPDILVNNAGITRDNLLMRMSEKEWDAVINTNLTSIYRMSKSCMRYMMKNRWGRIISISSVSGVRGNPGQTNYCAAKAGLTGFSKALAREIATRNVTVNMVAPGFIDTKMTTDLPDDVKEQIVQIIPMSRMGAPEDIAKAVAFLASDDASYITGETIHVNGGMEMV